jgi:hypothetical protein
LSNGKNHNSILFLTTLGVYLGLVLVGATPQVLAQAAMTRQFDVKDEIEVKDDLDKKPDNPFAEPTEGAYVDTENRITRSVERFLAQFWAVDSINPLCNSANPEFEVLSSRRRFAAAVILKNIRPHRPLEQIVVITNLARADLDPLFA